MPFKFHILYTYVSYTRKNNIIFIGHFLWHIIYDSITHDNKHLLNAFYDFSTTLAPNTKEGHTRYSLCLLRNSPVKKPPLLKRKQWKAVMIRKIHETQNIWEDFVEHLGLEFF